jgi:Ca-activated chloride channel homolog
MRKITLFFAMNLAFSILVLGQSSENTTKTPSETTGKTENESIYSESKPNRERPTLKLSPGFRKNVEKKKKKKLEANKTATAANDDETIKIESNLVTFPVSVYDRQGFYVSDLAKENFKVFENGEEQEVAYFGTTDKPIYVVLVIDTSPSAHFKMQEIRDSAKAFVRKLKPEDQLMVIRFDGNRNVLTGFTQDRQKIDAAIEKCRWGSGTAIYDAIDFTLNKKLEKIEGRKAIVLFTDGIDTNSRKVSFDESLYLAEESGVIIFPVYFNTYKEDRNSIIRFLFNGLTFEDSERGKKYVSNLADLTGGKITVANSEAAGLTRAFESIAEELRRQYYIGYYPKKDGESGERREIKVRVNRPNLAVRSRDSYIIAEKK